MRTDLIALILAFICLGCVPVQKVGPLWDKTSPTVEPRADDSTKSMSPEMPNTPVVQEAPKPPAPVLLVRPSEVNAATAADSVEKLNMELEQDLKNFQSLPRYSEVSRVGR